MPTDSERAHFRTIALMKSQEKSAQIQRAARDSTANGILVGLRLARGFPMDAAMIADESCRAHAQIGLRQAALKAKLA